jgi:hypothetical protein
MAPDVADNDNSNAEGLAAADQLGAKLIQLGSDDD